MPKVSVIVPIYGVEKYIERCARSLFGQTLNGIEFIFVDDCTPDGSMEILGRIIDEYRPRFAGKNWTVRTERMLANSGLPAVRQHGIQLATGDYIIHCDSDDWVDTDMYRSMYEKAIKENADVVVCDYIVHDGEKSLEIVKGCHETNIEKFKDNLLFQKDSWALWNKLFRRTVYMKDIVFPKGNMGEDMVMTLQLVDKCFSVGYVPGVYYFYRYNNSSITKTLIEDKIYMNYVQAQENVRIIELFFKKRGESKKVKSAINTIKWGQNTILFPILHNKKYYKLWRNFYPGLERQILFDSNCKVKIRLKCLLTLLHIYPWRKYGNHMNY